MGEIKPHEEVNSWEESNREDCEEMSLIDMCSWGEAN